MARLIFPVPVFLNRLAAPLCVFILGIIFFRGPCVPMGQNFRFAKILHPLTLAVACAGLRQTCRRAAIGGTVSSFSGSCTGTASRRRLLWRLLLLRFLLRLL